MFELSKHRQIQILGQRFEIFCSLFFRVIRKDNKEGFLDYKNTSFKIAAKLEFFQWG